MLNFDWEYITALFFALAFLLVILMTIGFYVNFKKDQWNRKSSRAFNPVHGRFFKRYVPRDLHEKYSKYLEV